MKKSTRAVPIYDSWGLFEESANRSRDWGCPNCDWRDLGTVLFRQVVGFRAHTPYEDSLGTVKMGLLIIECPRCFEKYFFHVDKNFAQRVAARCYQWPKR